MGTLFGSEGSMVGDWLVQKSLTGLPVQNWMLVAITIILIGALIAWRGEW
jgi:hypothetical protein